MVYAIVAAGIVQTLSAGAGGCLSGEFYKSSGCEPFTLKASYSLSAPRVTPLSLTLDIVAPNGIGAKIDIALVHYKGFKANLGFGAFAYIGRPVTLNWYDRDYDATVSLRLEQKVSKKIGVFVEQQSFIIGPGAYNKFAVFSYPMYEESIKCGQSWVGLSRYW